MGRETGTAGGVTIASHPLPAIPRALPSARSDCFDGKRTLIKLTARVRPLEAYY